ncbi:MAG TPA: ATP-binding cassette domain-containing protein [Spirochaetota bacterium]|nr:ATP-binding cassette domain-containing protein [Spirochaetota bacterium]
MNEYIYELENIEHGYGNFKLLVPELKIEKGASLGLAGPNGSGKSTLMRLLAKLEEPASGSLVYSPKGRSHHSVTMLQQDAFLLKRKVYDNVVYGLRARGETTNLKERVAAALKTVNLDPAKFMGRKWHQLSGGEAQRVALAARIILKPEVLLLDEPVANVDEESSRIISETIRTMKSRHNTTVIVSSHDLTWLASVTENILKLSGGKILGSGNSNIINGPWTRGKDMLWHASLPGGVKIYSSGPHAEETVAVLHPNDIILSKKKPAESSARNCLEGVIKLMVSENSGAIIRVEAEVSGKTFNAYITKASASRMKLYPGSKVYMIFKATSIVWQ